MMNNIVFVQSSFNDFIKNLFPINILKCEIKNNNNNPHG